MNGEIMIRFIMLGARGVTPHDVGLDPHGSVTGRDYGGHSAEYPQH